MQETPVELAQAYNQAGADELVFLDITATHEDRDIIYDVVYQTRRAVFIPLTVGGGINSLETIKKLFKSRWPTRSALTLPQCGTRGFIKRGQ